MLHWATSQKKKTSTTLWQKPEISKLTNSVGLSCASVCTGRLCCQINIIVFFHNQFLIASVCWLFTRKVRVESQGSLFQICDAQCDSGAGSYLTTSILPPQLSLHQCSILVYKYIFLLSENGVSLLEFAVPRDTCICTTLFMTQRNGSQYPECLFVLTSVRELYYCY